MENETLQPQYTENPASATPQTQIQDPNTETFKTSAGHEVVIRKHISARQALELRQIRKRSIDFEGTFDDGEVIPKGTYNHDASDNLELKTIELYLISFDGITENVLDALLDRGTENCLNEVINKLNEVTAEGKKE